MIHRIQIKTIEGKDYVPVRCDAFDEEKGTEHETINLIEVEHLMELLEKWKR